MSIFFKIILKIRKQVIQKAQRIYRNSTMLFKKNEIRIRYPLKTLRKPLRHLRKNDMPFTNLKWNLQNSKLRRWLMKVVISRCLLVLSRVVSFSFPTINQISLKKRIRKNVKSISARQPHILSITKTIQIRISISKGEP